ncbi:MAG: TldD/PmbA family protein [Candidatus Cloacimonetes bacterium]|nr:TldD/PmbA family protein [Candidatus Cloacimonadota bacterium]
MLSQAVIERVLERALSGGADFAEIFAENQYYSNIQLNDSRIKQAVVGRDYGGGVRVFYGHSAIYAYTNELTEAALLAAANAVSKAASGEGTSIIALERRQVESLHPMMTPADKVAKEQKVEVMRKLDRLARAAGQRIVQVDVAMVERMQHVMIANSEGLWVEDDRTYTRISCASIAEKDGEKQTGRVSPGAHAGFEFIEGLDLEYLANESARTALTMIDAGYAPSGKFPVIIDNAFGGVVFHEACGHALETTSVAKGASVFADKLGQQIAPSVVTAIDDGTMNGMWGSENIDDEGMPAQRTVLIENGILKSFMVDKLGGRKTGYSPTGSGRRQGYKYAPTSRMRNTYIDRGEHSLDQLIASVDYGLYAKQMGGGSVMPGTGNFNFSVLEGYMIRGGKIAEPVRGATLIGNGPESLTKISMVADNLAFAEGMCGSVSGSVPTCVGQPAIKVDEIVVGGRKE